LRSAAEQLETLVLLLQVTVPGKQFAVAVQRDFSPIAGRFAAGVGATGAASEATNSWSVALSTGADGDEPGSAIAGDIIRPRAARVSTNPRTNLFIAISFLKV
jgi:hypothetical protein